MPTSAACPPLRCRPLCEGLGPLGSVLSSGAHPEELPMVSSVAEPDLSRGVLVVGAGPTGLMAASLLARFNIPVRIIDKSEGAAKESRAMVVQAHRWNCFSSLGWRRRSSIGAFRPRVLSWSLTADPPRRSNSTTSGVPTRPFRSRL